MCCGARKTPRIHAKRGGGPRDCVSAVTSVPIDAYSMTTITPLEHPTKRHNIHVRHTAQQGNLLHERRFRGVVALAQTALKNVLALIDDACG